MPRSRSSEGRSEAGMLRVLQLTDTHLYADPRDRLLGQDTRQSLELVLEAAFCNLQPVDLVLLTGDLVHDESPEGYSYLRRRMTALDTPFRCLPGNHDNPALLSGALESNIAGTERVLREGGWNLILLDSTIPGEDGGHLDDGQLRLLDDALSARRNDSALVCLHHQPVPVGSAWMDTMALDNPREFFRILDHNPQVRGVLWGHVHQEYASVRNGVRLLGSPSTCVQFLPGSAEFALDERTPGYRWLKLHADGRIDTGVERIAAYPDPLDLTNGGY